MRRVINAIFVVTIFASLTVACATRKEKSVGQVAATPASENKEPKLVTVSKEGITFTFDANDYGEITSKRIKKQVFDDPMPAMAAPEHSCIYLQDKRPLPGFDQGPRYYFPARSTICVLPLQDRSERNYLKAYTEIHVASGQLLFLLGRRIDPIKWGSNLLLPDLWESIRQAGGSMTAKYSTQKFQAGEGILFLTQYSQDMHPTPANNEELTYSFQGITDDRQFYVAAAFAITHPELPPGIDSTRSIDSYLQRTKKVNGELQVDNSYLEEDEKTLEKLAEESFQPSLKKIQALISTLKIEGASKLKDR
mgnify:CR=1 FL=1